VNKLRPMISFIKNIVEKIERDNVDVYSAQAAFFIIIAFFPTAMLILSLINFLPFSIEQLKDFSVNFLPPQAASLVNSVMAEIFEASTGTVLSVATITALWSASRGLFAVIKGLNVIYGVEEKRGYIQLRLVMMFYMLTFMATLIITLTILVFGGTIADWLIETFPALENAPMVFTSVRWVLGFCLLVLFFWALYSFAPGRKTHSLWEFPGAIISAVGWLGFSALYSFYISNFANYSYLYGSLTAIVLLMLWLYICMNIMFFGAEINVVLRNERVKAAVKRLRVKIRGGNGR